MTHARLLLADADVLIDYAEADLEILALVSRYVGRVKVVDIVLDEEVRQISRADCGRLELEVIETEAEQVLRAQENRSSLSLKDCLCLVVARELGYELISNDRALRRRCEEEGIAVSWGLALMLDLLQGKHLSLKRALITARAIHVNNPHHINRNVLSAFERKAKVIRARTT